MSSSAQMLTVLYQDANKMYYEIDGQINNLYSMHSRQSNQSGKAAADMTDNDVEMIRERIELLRIKHESL